MELTDLCEEAEVLKREALDSLSDLGDLDSLLLDSPEEEEESADYTNEEFEDR